MTCEEKRDFILQDREWSYFAYRFWHKDWPSGRTLAQAYKIASKD
jgi:hypothetical protein